MKKTLSSLLLMAVALFAMTSCNDAAKMAEAANQVKISCTPEVLEVVAGEINADVVVSFPAKYFDKKAIVKVVPVIKYEGGEVAGEPFYYQGEKVLDNGKLVIKDEGASLKEKINFKYVKGMEKSELVARATVLVPSSSKTSAIADESKCKVYPFPNDIKIADGANTTYMLICKKGAYELKDDGYQEVIPETAEAQILYLINSSEVRSSQLKSQGIKDFKNALKALESDSRREVKGTDIVAYASPDGGYDLNDKLAANREKSAQKAFGQVTKKLNAGDVKTTSIAEDWEGFSELVNNSTIEDKELILRVLSMYSDPNVREQEIKNMSAVYTSLAKNVLPQLRRARFITNVEYTNYTADELTDLVENNISVLDEPALLRAATLVKGDAKLAVYDQAISKYDSEKAKFNAACVCLDNNDLAGAKSYIAKASDKCKCVKNLKGVIAMREGDNDAAEQYFTAAGDAGKENLAVINVLKGDYNAAAANLSGAKGYNKAVVDLLVGNAFAVEGDLSCKCASASYVKAVAAARQGDKYAANDYLNKAKEDASLAKRAETDVEFAKIK